MLMRFDQNLQLKSCRVLCGVHDTILCRFLMLYYNWRAFPFKTIGFACQVHDPNQQVFKLLLLQKIPTSFDGGASGELT